MPRKAPSITSAMKAAATREKNRVLAIAFKQLCKHAGVPMPVTEYHFHPERGWRWDYAWVEEKLALEVDGGLFTGGAHVRGARILKTHEKLNAAAAMGWRVLYRVPSNLCAPDTITTLREALTTR